MRDELAKMEGKKADAAELSERADGLGDRVGALERQVCEQLGPEVATVGATVAQIRAREEEEGDRRRKAAQQLADLGRAAQQLAAELNEARSLARGNQQQLAALAAKESDLTALVGLGYTEILNLWPDLVAPGFFEDAEMNFDTCIVLIERKKEGCDPAAATVATARAATLAAIDGARWAAALDASAACCECAARLYPPASPALGLEWLRLAKLRAHCDELAGAVDAWERALRVLRVSHGEASALVRDATTAMNGAKAELAYGGAG